MRMQSWTKGGILPLKVGGLPRTDMRPRRIKELSNQEILAQEAPSHMPTAC